MSVDAGNGATLTGRRERIAEQNAGIDVVARVEVDDVVGDIVVAVTGGQAAGTDDDEERIARGSTALDGFYAHFTRRKED